MQKKIKSAILCSYIRFGGISIKKIVLTTLNSKYIHSSLSPWCLRAGVKEYSCTSFDCEVIEGTVNEDISLFAQKIIDKKPDIIGFSIYIWNKKKTYSLIEIIKNELRDVPLVAGGPEVAYNPCEVLSENKNIDYILSGEGEYPFAALADRLANSEDISGICGLSFRKNGEIISNEPYISNDDPPSPYSAEYLSNLNGRIAYLETSRGCPYSCAFCLSGRCENVRFFDVEKSKQNMLLLANSGAKTIKLLDRTFNADRKRAKEIFSFIISEYGKRIPIGVCFHFEISGELLDEETLSLLSEAPRGAIQFEIGIQSFNPQTLQSINRRSETSKLKENIKSLLKRKNIHIHIDLIAGLPYEDLKSFENSFDEAYFLGSDMLQLGFLKLLHGAPMRENTDKYPCEFSEAPPYEVLSTPWLSETDLQELHFAEIALDKLYNSSRFNITLDHLMSNSPYTPYKFFNKFGKYIAAEKKERCSLDELINTLYDFLLNDGKTDIAILRDKMMRDRLANSSTGVIPERIRINDEKLLKIKKYLQADPALAPNLATKRSIAILYTENSAIFADYCDSEKENGKYKIHEISLDIIK